MIAPEELSRRIRGRFVQRGLVAEAELTRVSRVADERKTTEEDVLVSTGVLTEDQVAAVMAEELGVPLVFPFVGAIDPELLALFPAELLKRRKAIPMQAEEDGLVVATSDPASVAAVGEFVQACGCAVRLALAPRRYVDRALARLLPPPDDAARLADPGAVTLFYGHLAKAIEEGAPEVRFEPIDGALVVRYKAGLRNVDRGREPLAFHAPLVARARMLLGSCRGASSFDTMGTLQTRLAGREVTITLSILPSRSGEIVAVRLAGRDAAPPPAPAVAAVAEPAPAVPAAPAAPPLPSMDIASLLLFTKEMGGSDLHLSAGAVPMVRVHGEMRKLVGADGQEAPPCKADEIRSMVLDVLTDAQKARLEAEKELDFAMSIGKDTRFRGNAFFQDRGMAAVFRVIPTVIKTCEELGLPPTIKALAELEKGLVLCTGPTGSGKSTTLAAIVDHINANRRGHILTIEDPIEFVHQPKSCMVNQREVGRSTKAFANALKSALREDPDVILVGEMRDLETIALAITAAETGHLAFGTLHTSSAAKTVDRIINVFPAGEQAQIRAMLAESLQAVIAQVLLPKKGGKGRVAAQEILLASTGVKSMIREGKTYQIPSAIQTGAKYGMQSLEQCLTKLSVSGLVEASEVERQLAALGLSREDSADATMRAAAASPPAAARPAGTNTTRVIR